MRKYKQVHRKDVVFSLLEWAEVERRAAACHITTTAFIRDRAINSEMLVMNTIDLTSTH